MTPQRSWTAIRRAGGKALVSVGVGLAGLAGLTASLWAPASAATATDPTSVQVRWSLLSKPYAPPALEYPSAAYDSDNDTLVLFGGMGANGALSNNTWVWNGLTWTDYPGTHTQVPAAREMASMAFDPVLHQLILFGGLGAQGQGLDDTWAWNGLSWYQESSAVNPSPRYGATFAYDGQGQLVLFGGTTNSSWSISSASTASPGLDTTSTTAPSTTVPSPTSDSSADSGGSSPPPDSTVPPEPSTSSTTSTSTSSTTSDLADTWLWTADQWVESKASGPPARAEAAMAYDSSSHDVVLFSGSSISTASAKTTLLSDTWTWNGSRWSRQTPKASPQPRTEAVEVDQPSARGVVLLGGAGKAGLLGDTWSWAGGTWTKVGGTGGPPPRAGAASAYLAADRSDLVFGGVSSTGGVLGDTWTFLASLLPSTTTTSVTNTTRPAGHSGPATTVLTTESTSTTTTGAKPSTVTLPAAKAGAPKGSPLGTTAHSVRRGEMVTLSGSGFSPGADITITFHSVPAVVGHAVAGSDGRFTATVSVPDDAAPGHHHFEATGSMPSGRTAVLSVAVVVVVPGSPGPTPGQSAVMVSVALLLPAGAWAVMSGADFVRRRRRPTRSSA